MIVNQFRDLQDKRSLNIYRQYVEAGLANQEIAIMQYIRDLELEGWQVNVKWLDKNKRFASKIEGIESYSPDVTLKIKKELVEREAVFEVKVTDKKITEWVDIKAWQIDYLFSFYKEALLFYADSQAWMIAPVEWIYRNCEKVISKKVGDKECYKVWTPAILNKGFFSCKLKLNSYPNE